MIISKNEQTKRRPLLTGKILLREIVMRLFRDTSALSLLISNSIVVVLALYGKWNLPTLMAVYLAQSLIVGIFNVLKILSLKTFSTEGLRIGGKLVEATRQGKFHAVFIFIVIYGLFHAGYAMFILVAAGRDGIDIDTSHIFLTSFYFLLHHMYSFFRNRMGDKEKVHNIGTMIAAPFIRIFPMHLTIIFGGFISMIFGYNVLVIIVFLSFKIITDLFMHAVEHMQWSEFTKQLSSQYDIPLHKKPEEQYVNSNNV